MILSIDIGGTFAKLGLLTEEGQILSRREESVCFDGYRTPILDTVLAASERLLREENARVEGIAVSATGQIDTALGTVAGTNGKIPNYEGAPIKAAMEERFRVPCWVLNDANAAALGESFMGAGRGCPHMLMVTLGTGVGGGLVLNGRIYGGSRGFAGELGHFTLYQDGMPCSCGKKGCLECYASAAALVRRSGAANGRALFEQVRAGDSQAQSALNAWLDDLAAGLTGLVHIFNPQLILIGGGISAQEELLINPLREKVLSRAMPRFAQGLAIERAVLGNDAGMIGALKFWLDQEGVKP